jgi:hypothetical protein
MADATDKPEVWIGVVGVVPRELEENRNSKHVRYATFYTFHRVM